MTWNKLAALRARFRPATSDALPPSDALGRRVLRLAMPAVGEQFLSLMVGTVNTMLVGHLGAASLTAVGLSSTILMIATTFFGAVATGATALVAQAVGAQNRPLANRVLGQALLMALFLGLLGQALVFPLREQSLILMGAEPEAVRMGVRYLTCIASTLPLLAVMMVGNAALRGSGDTRTPMFVMAGVNLVNLLVSYMLIRGVGPLPELGVTGAGIAAALATALGALAVLAALRRGGSQIKLTRLLSRPEPQVMRRLLGISLPAGGESLLMNFAFLAYARSISSLGTVAYAAYLVAQRIESLNTMPAMGFAVAATALSGQAIGAGQPDQARRSVLKTIQIALFLAGACALCSLCFPTLMLGLFTNDPQVIAQGVLPVRIVAIAQPLMSIAFCLAGGLRGAGDTRSAMYITGAGAWLVRVPAAILSVTWLKLGLPGVQASMMLDWLTRALLLSWRFRPEAWQKRAARLLGTRAVAPR